MDFRRILAQAFARRIAIVIVALVVAAIGAMLGIGEAYAHTPTTCPAGVGGQPAACTREAAYAEANKVSNAKYHCSIGFPDAGGYATWTGVVQSVVVVNPNNPENAYYAAQYGYRAPNGYVAGCGTDLFFFNPGCPAGKIWREDLKMCGDDCSINVHSDNTFTPPHGSLKCGSGMCEEVYLFNADGTMSSDRTGQTCKNDSSCDPGYYFIGGLNVCAPNEPPECPEGTTKVGGKCEPRPNCPVGQVLQADGTCKPKEEECPAGQVKAPDGSCVNKPCPPGYVKGADGTCKKDENEDGDPDEGEDDDSFSGGDDCSSPPACSGSPILCGQARIQWRIECNTRRNRNIAGGACNATPICTGEKCDALEYASLLQQWKAACALEKLAGKKGDDGDGEQPNWTKVGGMSQNGGDGETAGDKEKVKTKTVNVNDLDQGGWLGGGGSCPAIMAGGGNGIGAEFAQVMASPPGWFCNGIGMFFAINLLLAAVTAGYILSRG